MILYTAVAPNLGVGFHVVSLQGALTSDVPT